MNAKFLVLRLHYRTMLAIHRKNQVTGHMIPAHPLHAILGEMGHPPNRSAEVPAVRGVIAADGGQVPAAVK